MKRFFIIFLAIMLLVTAGALADDYSALSNEELYALLNSIRAELLSRELTLSPEQVLMENDVVSMILDNKDIEFTKGGYLKIPVVLISNSENEISFQTDSCMVNGWECHAVVGNISSNGKKRDTIEINCKQGAEISSIEEIEDIRIAFTAFNMGTYKNELVSDPILLVIENGQLVRK